MYMPLRITHIVDERMDDECSLKSWVGEDPVPGGTVGNFGYSSSTAWSLGGGQWWVVELGESGMLGYFGWLVENLPNDEI